MKADQKRNGKSKEWRYKKVTSVTSQGQTFQERYGMDTSSELANVISSTGDSGNIGENTQPLEVLSKME